MKKKYSIKKNYQFRMLMKKGKKNNNHYVAIWIRKNNSDCNRLGIAIKKDIKSSVLRNRIKRIIREIYRLELSNLKKGYDILILNYSPDISYNEAKIEIQKSFKVLNLYKEV